MCWITPSNISINVVIQEKHFALQSVISWVQKEEVVQKKKNNVSFKVGQKIYG